MHEEHRKRVRERFLESGLSCFPPHNVLELLLFYSIPRRDTNEIAHHLLDQFGSLTAVLEAPFEELCKVEGIGEASAALITLTSQLAKRYLNEQAQEKLTFETTAAFHQYVVRQYLGVKNEAAFLLCLDNNGRLLRCVPASLGTKYELTLDNRTLLETAFRHNATKIVLAHNHPNGLAVPSKSDIKRTESAMILFRSVNIQLLDHLIVAGQDCFSMAAHPRFGYLFFQQAEPQPVCAESIP
ncbi:MAG: DNA repair protein RadC [Oscillospiraceae bacterium]|nr:DNA repair protein RadC [Oscillospiraceae bacterium]